MQKIALILLFSFFLTFSFSQNYFQQEVNYTVSVKLNDVLNSLTGYISIEYVNNSPDTLTYLYFHLWANAYKNNKTQLALQMAHSGDPQLYFEYKKIGGYIDSLEFKVDNSTLLWDFYENNIDIAKLTLNQSLLPNQKITITTPFYVKLPSGDISRMGFDKHSYQISQWFPKPAVYDATGWHQMPYLNYGEFYSEFGSFDVTIEIPKQYVVAATGEMQNSDEINWINELVINRKTGNMITNPSENEFKKVRFIASDVHDFAWFASKDYLVEKSEVILPHSSGIVTTWTMYFAENKGIWEGSTDFVNDAVYFYSDKVGDYPYKNCSAVQGALKAGGGMEYPMITVISAAFDKNSLETVIMHEVGHNWFYGIMGTNERDFPYLDEGLNSFYETRYIENKYPDKTANDGFGLPDKVAEFLDFDNKPYHLTDFMTYAITSGLGLDAPINSASDELDVITYYSVIYKKAAAAYYYLMSYLGEEKFDSVMKDFFIEWKFKHPQPDDFKQFFETKSGEDLTWFFDELIGTTKKVDYKIYKLTNKKLIIKNKGKISAPVYLSVIENNTEISHNWINSKNKKNIISTVNSDSIDYSIDKNFVTFDFNKTNNFYSSNKPDKKLAFKFLTSFVLDNRLKINFIPTFGYSSNDKLLVGIFLHNMSFPKKKFQYKLLPFIAFRNANMSGVGIFDYEIFSFNQISLKTKLQFKRFSRKYNNSNNIFIQQSSDIEHIIEPYIRLKLLFDLKINNTEKYQSRENHFIISALTTEKKQTAFEVKYQYYKKSAFNPFDLELGALNYTGLVTHFSLEMNYLQPFFPKTSVQIRFFSSLSTNFDYSPDNSIFPYIGISGISSYEDFVFDNFFIGRSNNLIENPNDFFNHQFINNNGGFGLYTPFGAKSQYLISLNFKFNTPVYIRPYFNVAYYEGAGNQTFDFNYFGNIFQIKTKPIAYELGISIPVIKNKIEFYFPLYASKDILEYGNQITDNYLQKVRILVSFGGESNIQSIISKFAN